MNSRIFYISLLNLELWNLATFLRTTIRVTWLRALLRPVNTAYKEFYQFRYAIIYKMSHNSQVVYLRKILNDKFDPDYREIRLQNLEVLQPVWHYDSQEEKPVYYYDSADSRPVYFRDTQDFQIYNADGEVVIPLRLRPADATERADFEAQIKLIVDYYKLYSKQIIYRYE